MCVYPHIINLFISEKDWYTSFKHTLLVPVEIENVVYQVVVYEVQLFQVVSYTKCKCMYTKCTLLTNSSNYQFVLY